MYQVYKSRRGIKRSEDSKVRAPRPWGPRPLARAEFPRKVFLTLRLEGGLPGAGSATLPSGLAKKGQEEVLGVTLLRRPDSLSRGVGRRGASQPLPLAPTASPCALQETYKLPHRLIEKKRRDRINECIAQLKDLLPEHLKLTVSEKLAALQASSSSRGRAGVTRRLQGPRGTAEQGLDPSRRGSVCGVRFPNPEIFWKPHENHWTSPSWLQHQLAFLYKSFRLSF